MAHRLTSPRASCEDVEASLNRPLVEDGKQDAFAVADLRAGRRHRAWLTRGHCGSWWLTAFGSSRLPCGESLGEGVQLGVGQSRVSSERDSRSNPVFRITVIPTPLMTGSGEHFVERRPQPQRAVADGQQRRHCDTARLE